MSEDTLDDVFPKYRGEVVSEVNEGCGREWHGPSPFSGEVDDWLCASGGYRCPDCRKNDEPDKFREPGSYAPFVAGEHFEPDYYGQQRKHPLIGEGVDVEDFVWVFGLDAQSAEAIRHIVRHGRKEGEPAAKDLTKAMEWCQRRISFLAMEDGEQ